MNRFFNNLSPISSIFVKIPLSQRSQTVSHNQQKSKIPTLIISLASVFSLLILPQAKADDKKLLNKCLNTLSGGFARKGTTFSCRVEQPLGAKKLKDKSGGLVEGALATIDFNMDLNLKFLKGLVLKKQLHFPSQFVNLKLLLAGGQEMPMKMTLNPIVHLKGDIFSGNLQAYDATPNITSLKSKLLPSFFEKRLIKELNQDKDLKTKMVMLTNGAFSEAVTVLGID